MKLSIVMLYAGLASSLFACGGGGSSGSTINNLDSDAVATTPPAADVTEHWGLSRVSARDVSLQQAEVDAVLDHIFSDAATQSALVSKNGYVVGERYADGFDAASLGTSWSVAKSFYSAAMGVAIEEGYLTSVTQPASTVLTEFIGTEKESITLQQILRMRSGLASNTNVFFSGDQTAHALANTLTSAPGSGFDYSNANSQLFEPLLARATGMDAHSYLSEKILRPIGIDPANVGLWLDETGTQPMTYCCLDMRPDDFLRFGLLFARNGRWQDTQVVPADYVSASLNPVGFYGYQWWAMNEDYFGEPVRGDIKSAIGLNGQRVLIWPEHDIVVVVLTQYQHFASQGYVLNLQSGTLNFPDTCSGRNSCIGVGGRQGSTGPQVPTYDLHDLVEMIVDLAVD
ncbi:MAG: serine hydrolase [Proteobacteria bacterium]|nr:serine hydrolase [Pseudomonadota bacterium]